MIGKFVPTILMAIAMKAITMAPLTSLTVTDDQLSDAFNDLAEFVAIPSVSSHHSPYYSMETLNAATDFVTSRLSDLGFNVWTVNMEGIPPYILGEFIIDKSKPTFLLYAHYDVQPVDERHWHTPPFELTERNGRLYGRGASDDKAGIIAILTALEAYRAAGIELPVNLKILFEGEEEVGSPNMGYFLRHDGKQLNADALIVMDGMNRSVNIGALTSATRGIVKLNLFVEALDKPVHSGIGCLVPDPAQGLAQLIASLRDPRAIPGFMDDCLPVSRKEKQLLSESSQTAESYAEELGVLTGLSLRGSENESIYERVVSEPSISVVNMTCGQPNGGNSIQSVASCQIGVRITAGQNPERIANLLMDYIADQPIMNQMRVRIENPEKGSWAWKADLTQPYLQMYHKALKSNFSDASYMPMGGALPLLREFLLEFPDMDMIIPGVEDPYTSAHSHNESQDIKVFEKSVNSLIDFFDQAGK